MDALILQGNRVSLQPRETPRPGDGDVVVEVRAAGINAADLLQRKGHYPAPPGWPSDIPGLEMAGVVVSVGEHVDPSILGSRVCAVVGGGAQATHCLVPAEHLLPVPTGLSWSEAGGFAEAFTTAFDALVTQGSTRAGERVLISGAAGGVGVAGVQIAHAFGAHVTAVTRDRTHHEQLRSLGADETITLDEVDDIEPVDVVLELVGAAHLTRALRRLNQFARLVVIGVGSGSRVEVDLLTMMSTRAVLTGSTLRSRSRREKGEVAQRVTAALQDLWSAGTIRVPVDRQFPLAQGDEAYDYFAQPGKFGKVVLVVQRGRHR